MAELTPIDLTETQPEEVRVDHRGVRILYPGGVWQVGLDFATITAVRLTVFQSQILWWLADEQSGDWLVPVGVPGENTLRQALQNQFPGFDGHSMYRFLDSNSDTPGPVTLWTR